MSRTHKKLMFENGACSPKESPLQSSTRLIDHYAETSEMVTPVVKESLTVDTAEPTELPKRVLYIAGPMRGIAWFNYPMFDRIANELRLAGNEVISPADEDRKQDGFDPFKNPIYQHADNCVFPIQMDFSTTVRRCLDAVLRCDEIVLLPGWERSSGAVAELTLAMWLDKRVRHARIDEEDHITYLGYWMGIETLAANLFDYHFPARLHFAHAYGDHKES